MILYFFAAVGALCFGALLLVLGVVLMAAKWAGWEE